MAEQLNINTTIPRRFLMKLDLKQYVTDVQDYPSPGILFKDITPLIKDVGAFAQSIDQLAYIYRDQKFDIITGIESRGFIFACPLALKLQTPFVPIRKAGKLPRETIEVEYELEYGSSVIEIHKDAIEPGSKVLILDDVLATGGTLKAAAELIRKSGSTNIHTCTVIELLALEGRALLSDLNLTSLITF
jgi:adenine phosphoribosyltransferase